MGQEGKKNVVELEARGLIYSVRVLIRHPTEALECVTTATGISPLLLNKSGDPRTNSRGMPLSGFFPHSTWSWWQEFRDSRDFGSGVARALEILAPAAKCLANLRKSGGQVSVILELRGERNIGDYIRTRELARMAGLGIDFGIEVFPHTHD